jgi:hypothetical protein
MNKSKLSTYWIVVRVDLAEALSVQGAEVYGFPPSAIGYYQKFGVTQASENDARQLIAGQILPSGALDWDESTISAVNVGSLEPRILAQSGDWTRPGIWYRSGRIFVVPDA